LHFQRTAEQLTLETSRAIGRLSHSNITVLINGESRTGK
ncbi:hypothetical protein PSYMO_37182, partial [Pseudomonas amygdali pv. mori str. 301020]